MSSISLIAAMNQDRVIGRDNALPWHVKSDLQNFKRITLGKPVIMGRKTFDSLNGPLPKRPNLIVTRDPFFKYEGVDVFKSIEDAIKFALDIPADEIMVIGGGQIFEATIQSADKMYLTVIDQIVKNGDAYFPEFNTSDWAEKEKYKLPTTEGEPSAEFTMYEHLKAA